MGSSSSTSSMLMIVDYTRITLQGRRLVVCLLFRCWEDIGDFTVGNSAHFQATPGLSSRCGLHLPLFRSSRQPCALIVAAPDLRLSGSVPRKRGATLYSGSWVLTVHVRLHLDRGRVLFRARPRDGAASISPTAPYSLWRGKDSNLQPFGCESVTLSHTLTADLGRRLVTTAIKYAICSFVFPCCWHMHFIRDSFVFRDLRSSSEALKGKLEDRRPVRLLERSPGRMEGTRYPFGRSWQPNSEIPPLLQVVRYECNGYTLVRDRIVQITTELQCPCFPKHTFNFKPYQL